MELSDLLSTVTWVGLSAFLLSPFVYSLAVVGSSTVCTVLTYYAKNHSKQFSSIEEMRNLLPREKRRLGILDYRIRLRHQPSAEYSFCKKLREKDFLIVLNQEGLNLAMLRHELRHVVDYGKFSYYFYREPRAVFYSLSSLKDSSAFDNRLQHH